MNPSRARGRSGEPRLQPWIRVSLFALALILGAAAVFHARVFYDDDAYITLRYATRLIHGQGLTFSDGERVEGFTNPLWLGQLALLARLGADPVAASRACGLVYLAALFVLWWRARWRLWALLLLATQPGLVLWSVGGLETVSFCFWLAWGAWLTLEASRRSTNADPGAGRCGAYAGATFAAAALTRPVGFGCGLLAVAGLLLHARRRTGLIAAAALLVPVAAYIAFRLAYFGDYLPNAARAKIGGLSLIWHVRVALEYLRLMRPDWLAATFAGAVAVTLAPSRRAGWVLALSLPVWAEIFLGGGDHMAGARLVLPIVVLYAVAAGLPEGGRPWRLTAATVLLCVAAALQSTVAFLRPVQRDYAASVGAPVGRFLQAHLPPGALVSTATAGATPYFAPALRFLDPLGLNDKHIARTVPEKIITRCQIAPGHQKGDGAYVLGRAPDLIILGPAEGYLGTDPKEWFLTDYQLLQSAGFREGYRPYRLPVPVDPQEAIDPGVAPLLDPASRTFVLTAYLRKNSAAAEELARLGTPLTPPW